MNEEPIEIVSSDDTQGDAENHQENIAIKIKQSANLCQRKQVLVCKGTSSPISQADKENQAAL